MYDPIFIAEIKTRSPFGYVSKHSFAKLMECAIKFGDWISVHDNALWGGDYESIAFVRRNTNKTILAKGLHATDDDIRRALDHGADYVLVVDREPAPELHDKCLFEWSRFSGLQQHPHLMNQKHVFNNRDLRYGWPKHLTELKEFVDSGAWVCQASNIQSKDDIKPGISAYIVGEGLMKFCNQEEGVLR
jgi:indole-3-glycerol phosphate synthase